MITSPGLIVACRSRANANSSTTNSSAANRRPAVSRRLIWTVSAASHLTASRCGEPTPSPIVNGEAASPGWQSKAALRLVPHYSAQGERDTVPVSRLRTTRCR